MQITPHAPTGMAGSALPADQRRSVFGLALPELRVVKERDVTEAVASSGLDSVRRMPTERAKVAPWICPNTETIADGQIWSGFAA